MCRLGIAYNGKAWILKDSRKNVVIILERIE
jgi:hypothetical protein